MTSCSVKILVMCTREVLRPPGGVQVRDIQDGTQTEYLLKARSKESSVGSST